MNQDLNVLSVMKISLMPYFIAVAWLSLCDPCEDRHSDGIMQEVLSIFGC